MTCSSPFSGRTRKERDGRRGRMSFCTSCLLSCLLLAFGFFLIHPANKSLKQFKRYALVKTLKTNYKLNSQKRGQKPAMKKEERERRKTKEKGREKVRKGAVQEQKEGCKTMKKRAANNQKRAVQKGER